MDGYPIRKCDIDDNYCVKKKIIDEIVSERKSNIYEIQTMSSNTVKSNGLPKLRKKTLILKQNIV